MLPQTANSLLFTGTYGNRLGYPLASRAVDIGTQEEDGTLLDKGPNGLNLVGNSGRAVEFVAASEDYASMPHSTDFDIAGKTVVISILFEIGANPSSGQALMSKGGGTGLAADGGWSVRIENDGQIGVLTKQAGSGVNHHYVTSTNVASTSTTNVLKITITNGIVTQILLNSIEETLIVVDETLGTYGDKAEPLYLAARFTTGSLSDFFSGYLAAISIETDGVVRGDWLLADHATGTLDGKPGFDRSGNGHHLTFTGCEVAGADFAWPVPQVGLMGWNRGYTLNGASQYIGNLTLPESVRYATQDIVFEFIAQPVSQSTFEPFIELVSGTISFSIYWHSSGIGGIFWGFGGSSDGINRAYFGAVPYPDGQTHTYRFEWSFATKQAQCYYDGALMGSVTVSSPVTRLMNSGHIGYTSYSSGYYFEGGIYSAQQNGIGFLGTGIPAGSPANIFLPESLATPGTDALGNPIDRLLKPGEFRPPQGGSGVIADDAALANVKTISLWTYYGGGNGTILDLGTPTITAASGAVATSGITSPTVYVNGVAGTALSVGWNHVAVTSATAFDCGPITVDDFPAARAIAYDDVEQAAAAILRIYRATKGAYS